MTVGSEEVTKAKKRVKKDQSKERKPPWKKEEMS